MSTSGGKHHEVAGGDANARNILAKLHMQEERKKAVGKSVAEQAAFNRKQSQELRQFESELQAKAHRFAALHADEVQEQPPVHEPVVVPPKPKVQDSHVWKHATGDGFARYYLEKKAAKLEAEKRAKGGTKVQAEFNRRKSIERQGFEDELKNYRLKKLQTAMASAPAIAEAPGEGEGGEEDDANNALKKQIIAAAMKKLGKKRDLPEPKLGIELGHVVGAVAAPSHIRADIPIEQGNTSTVTHSSAAPTRDYAGLSTRQYSASGLLEHPRGQDSSARPHHAHSSSLDVNSTPTRSPRDRSPVRGPPSSELPAKGSSVMSTPLPDVPAVPSPASVQRHNQEIDEVSQLLSAMSPEELAELLSLSSGPDPHEAALIAKLEACPEYSPERGGSGANRSSASAPSSAQSSPQMPRRTFTPTPGSTTSPAPPPPPPPPLLGSLSAPASSSLLLSGSAPSTTTRNVSVGGVGVAGSVSGAAATAATTAGVGVGSTISGGNSQPQLVTRASNISISVSDSTKGAGGPASSSSGPIVGSSPLARSVSPNATTQRTDGPGSSSSRGSPQTALPETRERRALSDASARAPSNATFTSPTTTTTTTTTTTSAPLSHSHPSAPETVSRSATAQLAAAAHSPASSTTSMTHSAAAAGPVGSAPLSWPTVGGTFTRPPAGTVLPSVKLSPTSSPEMARRSVGVPSTTATTATTATTPTPAPTNSSVTSSSASVGAAHASSNPRIAITSSVSPAVSSSSLLMSQGSPQPPPQPVPGPAGNPSLRPERPAPTGTEHMVASAPDSPDTKRSSKMTDPRTTMSLSGAGAGVGEGSSPVIARRILAMAVDTEADRVAAAEREQRRLEREERRAAMLKAAAASKP